MRKLKTWQFVCLTIVAPAIGVALQGVRSTVGSEWAALFIVGSLIFSIGAPIAAFWEKRYREDREVSLESEIERNVTEQRVALEDSISPLVDAIGQAIVTAPGERSSTGSRLIQQGINAIRSIIGRDGARVRVSFYKVVLNDGRRGNHFQLVSTTGRSRKPRPYFLWENADGSALVDMLTDNDPVFCSDISKDAPEAMEKKARDYKTFITCPAICGIDPLGFVTVDAMNVGDLTEDDVPFVRAIATVIAIGQLLIEVESDSQNGHKVQL